MVTLEVAVIGAGAAGLVASRALVRCGWRPTVLEATHRVGGAWTATGNMWESLTPNLSQYTCRFSEWPWTTNETTSTVGDFGTRRDMERYLESYAQEFIDPSCFHFGCHVTNVKPNYAIGDATTCTAFDINQKGRYRVEWTQQTNDDDDDSIRQCAQDFDAIVVATGFFAAPAHEEFSSGDSSGMRVIHSSQYQSLEKLKLRQPSDDNNASPTRIAVCGASFSAVEIAADLAKSASSTPPPVVVTSVLPRIPWIVPRHVPDEDGTFLPLDCLLYQRQTDSTASNDDDAVPEQVGMDEASCQARHAVLRQLVGRQKQRAALGSLPDEDDASKNQPPMVAISDDYLNLVLSDRIQVEKGSHSFVPTPPAAAEEEEEESQSSTRRYPEIRLDNGTVLNEKDVDVVIDCTGYKTRLDFLDERLLETLQYQPEDGFAPLVACYDTFHPQLPGLGFVGMYKGPYMGVMELQARLLAHLWSNPDENALSGEVIQQALEASQQRRHYQPRAQFPHFDYVGLMDSLARPLGLVPPSSSMLSSIAATRSASDSSRSNTATATATAPSLAAMATGAKGQMVTPAFYQPSPELARETLRRLERTRQVSDAIVAPSMILSALVGRWRFERTIHHFDTGLEQRVSGMVRFTVASDGTTTEKSSAVSPLSMDTLRYREDGLLHLPSGDMDVFREYEYCLQEPLPVPEDPSLVSPRNLEIYFVEGGERAGLFLSLQFRKMEDENGATERQAENKNGCFCWWEATSDHLCIKDLYTGKFRIAMEGIGARQATMTYRVEGPNKNYESVTKLEPSQ